MKNKIAGLILLATVAGIVYTDDCVYSSWQRGVCNCTSRIIPITRTLLSGGGSCTNCKKVACKTELTATCNCGKYIFTNNYKQLRPHSFILTDKQIKYYFRTKLDLHRTLFAQSKWPLSFYIFRFVFLCSQSVHLLTFDFH